MNLPSRRTKFGAWVRFQGTTPMSGCELWMNYNSIVRTLLYLKLEPDAIKQDVCKVVSVNAGGKNRFQSSTIIRPRTHA